MKYSTTREDFEKQYFPVDGGAHSCRHVDPEGSPLDMLRRLFSSTGKIEGRIPAFSRDAICDMMGLARTTVYDNLLKLRVYAISVNEKRRGRPRVYFVSSDYARL